MTLNKGTQYGIRQTGGSWTVDARNFPEVDAAGYSVAQDAKIYQGCKLNPAWWYGLLIGRIGDGPIFSIGRAASIKADRDGVLYLRIHDGDNCLGDNAGAISVEVDRGLTALDVLKFVMPGLFDPSMATSTMQYIVHQVSLLTPEEMKRLAEVGGAMAKCQAELGKAQLGEGCAGVILRIVSLVVDPTKVS